MHTYRLMLASLAMLLLSCGSTRHAVPSYAEELTSFVLIIEDAADGQVRHSWQGAAEFDLPRYDNLVSNCRT